MTCSSRPLLRTVAATSLVTLAAAAFAQYPYLESFQGLYAGNNGSFAFVDGHGGDNDASNPFVASASFTGLDSEGNQQTMSVSGSAYSSATYGAIHIFGQGTVSNPYYNPGNEPYYDGSGDPNPNGSPDLIAVHGNAGWGEKSSFSRTVQKATFIVACFWQ